MKRLKDFEEDIYKCSRCALCQSVCPVYKASLNECAVSKGKFNMLNGVLKGELGYTKQLKKYLDMCTGCNACKDFCPSGIDAGKIFIAAKVEYYKMQKSKSSVFERAMNSYTIFKTVLVFSKTAFFLYRILFFDKIVNSLEKILLRLGEIGKRILLLNSLASVSFNKKTQNSKSNTKTAIYFEGCFNKYINPQTEHAVKKILFGAGIEFVKKDFECCGVSYLADGNIDEFNHLVNKNISQLGSSDSKDFDFILTDCASCNSVLKEYKEFSQLENAKKISESVISVTELIKSLKFESVKEFGVAVHIPCHEDFDFVQIVKNIKNTTYIEAEDFNKCCGFSGTFAIKNAEISKEISKQKALHYIKSKADIVLTTCPACMLGLEQGFIEAGVSCKNKPIVMNLFVFLAKYCRVV